MQSALVMSVLPKAGRQVIGSSNPQAVSAKSQGASTVPPRQVVPRQSVLNPWVLTVFPLRQVVVS